MVSMLLRRDGGTYVLRRVIPAALRSIVGKRELRISPRTKNVEEAKQRMKAEGIKVDRILDAARAKQRLLVNDPSRLVESWKRKALI